MYDDSDFLIDISITMLNPMNNQIIEDDDIQITQFEPNYQNLLNEFEYEPLSDEVDEFTQTVESDSLPISKILIDAVEVHKARAINLLVNCPHRKSRDRTIQVFNSTPIAFQKNTSSSIDNECRSDIGIRLAVQTDTLITIDKLKDGNFTAIILSINKMIHLNQITTTIAYDSL